MDSNDKFWISLWSLGSITILTLACSYMYKSQQYDRIKLEALSKVADPIAFACAETISGTVQAKADMFLCIEKVRK